MLELAKGLYVVAGAGGGGIGTDTCTRIAEAGGTVLGLDKTEIGCETARAALGDGHRVVQIDLEDEAGLATVLEEAQRDFGLVRGLANIVGGIPDRKLVAPLLDLDGQANFERLIRLNLLPGLAASRAVARMMQAHGEGGSIVNTASMVGQVSMAYAAGYGASKAALMNLTRTMAVEWGRIGIRVNAVSPGTIKTAKIGRDSLNTNSAEQAEAEKAAERAVIPLGRRGLPDDVSDVILFFLSDLSRYVSGQILGVDGGAMARAPYDDADNVSVFITDAGTRARLKQS
ncbi:SDR family oxidoreductase [Sphingomonas crocodyli]|uniref:SDR family oxidoreductase n=2 Tax=Sphingomonas crocodyli TaxID=1979270 RepID=A0A437MBT1_9SPHN|nr:SDR family oxidoreductase [Sphingomonas crocodyli]